MVPAQDSLREFLDSGGGESIGVFRALADIGWSGVSLHTVLASTLKFYADYGEAIQYRDEEKCLRDSDSKLRAEQPRTKYGGIWGKNRLQPKEAARLIAEVFAH